jgi:hypothetical protein
MAAIDIPGGRQAIQAWRGLDRETRREVLRRARQGVGHPDPRVAAIAVGRTRATLRAPLWRWVAVAVLGLVVGWVLLWLLSHLIGALDGPWWLRLGLLLGPMLGGLAAWRVRLRQIEEANRQTPAR